MLTQALNDARDSIARISPVTDPKYNFTITASQIQNYPVSYTHLTLPTID